jgi:acyl-CoA synthetase (AMP-forming)/AMP-acid ligase II
LLGGGPVSNQIIQLANGVTSNIWEGYGMTETLTHVAMRDVRAQTFFKALNGVQFSQGERGNLIIEDQWLKLPSFETNDTIEFIEECLVENLNERERYWQDFYDVIAENGLNCRLTATNDKSGFLSESSKNKLSIAKKKVVIDGEWREKFAYDWSGKNHSEETKRKMSDSAKGKKKTVEHISKLPQNQKGYKSKPRSQEFRLNQKLFNGKSKAIFQYDKNNVLINQFISVAEAKRQTSIKTINSAVLGKTKTAGGFKWSYTKF